MSLEEWTDPLRGQWLTFAVHWLHVIAGVFWFGTVLYTRLMLFPSLRTLPPDTAQAVRTALVSGRNRRITTSLAVGTVVLGFMRGLLGHALDDPSHPYAITFMASAMLGALMVAFLVGPWGSHQWLRTLYVAAFPVIFTFMVLLRFGV